MAVQVLVVGYSYGSGGGKKDQGQENRSEICYGFACHNTFRLSQPST